MNKEIVIRILGVLALIIFAFSTSWWLFVLFGVAGMVYFKKFYEFPTIAFFIETIAGAPLEIFFGVQYVLTSLSIVLLIAVEFFRKKIW